MGISIGIILAFVAMIGWGFGDFFIQRTARRFGKWEPLFIITLFGAVILFPFVYSDLSSLFSSKSLWILILASFILFIAAVLDFEALREGKLDVVEPIWSLEIPISGILAFLIVGEAISLFQILLIITLIVGLVLVSFKSIKFSGKMFLEKGAVVAVIAAVIMGVANFFVGWGARVSDALMMNFILNVIIAFSSFIFIISRSRFKKMIADVQKNKAEWISMCIFDNSAWIAFAFAMTLAPVAITVALSDSYIIIAVLLGIYVNKEFLHKHQKFGIAIAIVSAITLAYISG